MKGITRLLESALEYWKAGNRDKARICYQIASHFSESSYIRVALEFLHPVKTVSVSPNSFCLKAPFYGHPDFFCNLCIKIISRLPDNVEYGEEIDEFGEKCITFGMSESGIKAFVEKCDLLDEHFYRNQYAAKGAYVDDFLAHFPERRLSQWLNFEKGSASGIVPGIWHQKKAKVSIICPIYNNYDYLEECANSLFGQTLDDIEIIFVNDGSTDSRVYDRLVSFRRMDIRARVLNKPNSGYGHSMNCGIMASNGEYIGIVESDDYVSPHMFKTLYDKSGGDIDIVKSHIIYFTGPKENRAITRRKVAFPPSGDYFASDMLDEYFKGVLINPCGIFRTDFIMEKKLFFNTTPKAAYQDIGFFLKTAFNAHSISIVNEYLYNVRRDNKASSVYAKDNMEAPVREYAEIGKYLDGNPEMKKKFLDFFQLKKLRSYRFTAGRLAPELKQEFMRIFAAEWKDVTIRNELFNSEELDWLKENMEPLLNGDGR